MDDEQVVEASPEQEAQEEAAFEAGFAGTDLEPATEPEPEPDPQPEPEPEPEPEPAPEPTAKELLALIEADRAERTRLESEQNKLRDRLYGKIGELQQKLEAGRKEVSGLSPQAKQRLQDNFPELVTMLFDEDEPEPQPEPAAQLFAPAPVAIPDVQDIIRKEVEPLKLAAIHSDWQTVVQTPEFAEWKTSVLDPEKAYALDTSWDAQFIGQTLTEYKQWSQAQAKAAQAAQAKKAKLDAAITPKGLPRGAAQGYGMDDDEEAAMLSAYGKRH